MLRGSLFDPFSQSGSSSRSRASEAGFTPSVASEVSSAQRSAGTNRSPAAHGVRFSPDLSSSLAKSTSSSSKRRAVEAQNRMSISPIEESSPRDDSNWSVSPVESPGVAHSGCPSGSAFAGECASRNEHDSSTVESSCLEKQVGIVAALPGHHPASSSTSTAAPENHSLSLSSISFGKDDARMRGADARDASAPAQPIHGPSNALAQTQAAQHVTREVTAATQISRPQLPGEVPKESVARQLDFDAVRPSSARGNQKAGVPAAIPLIVPFPQRQHGPGECSPSGEKPAWIGQRQPPRSRQEVSGSAWHGKGLQGKTCYEPLRERRSETGATASFGSRSPMASSKKAFAHLETGGSPWGTSGSEGETFDWDSSLSREVPLLSRTAGSSFALSSNGSNVSRDRRQSAHGCTAVLVAPSPATTMDRSLAHTLREFSPLRSPAAFSTAVGSSPAPSPQRAPHVEECPCCGSRMRASSAPVEASALTADGRQLPVTIERLQGEAGSILLQLWLGDANGRKQKGNRSSSRLRSSSRKAASLSPKKGHEAAHCALSPSSWSDPPTRSQSLPAYSTMRRARSDEALRQHVAAICAKYSRRQDTSLQELHGSVHALRHRFLNSYFHTKTFVRSSWVASYRPLQRSASDSLLIGGHQRQNSRGRVHGQKNKSRNGNRSRAKYFSKIGA